MRFFSFVFSVFLVAAAPAYADSVMFIDEGGNIHFVDSWQQVPPQYRNQLRKAPTPVPDPQTLKKLEVERKKSEQKAQKEKQQQEAEARQRRVREENKRFNRRPTSSPAPVRQN